MNADRRYLLVGIGSAGDVHPFVGIGRELAARGRRVTIVTSGHFESLVRRAGLEFAELFSANEYRTMIEDPRLWHPLRGPRMVLRACGAELARRVYDVVARLHEPGRTVVAAPTLALGALTAGEKLGIPTASVHLQPCVLRSERQPAKLTGMFRPRWAPRGLIRLQYWFTDVGVVDPIVLPSLNAFRRELNLPPIRRCFDRYIHSQALTIGLFPPWFAPPQPDWPPQVRLTDFPLYDEHDVTALDDDVRAFLDAGPPPIAFTPGSAMVRGERFFAAAADACARLGRRGILLTRHVEQIPKTLPAGVRHFPFVPFSRLLPRCAATVHHGGIGSLSQGFAAGVPQVVMPMAHDQPDNAERLEALGAGRAVPPRKFTGRRLAQTLDELLASPSVAVACRTIAARLQRSAGVTETATLLERL